MGLGLSICKEIITALGGEVKIKSVEGEGTDFIIILQTKCRVDEVQLEEAKQNFVLDSSSDSLSVILSDNATDSSKQSSLSSSENSSSLSLVAENEDEEEEPS